MLPSSKVQSQNISASQCEVAVNYLSKELKSADLRARVDRLAVYEYVYQYLELLTKRLNYNKQPDYEVLKKTLVMYREDIDYFVNSYEKYDESRQELANMDCQKDLPRFTVQLSKLRSDRKTLELATNDVQRMLRISMKNQLNGLYDKLLSGEPSGALN